MEDDVEAAEYCAKLKIKQDVGTAPHNMEPKKYTDGHRVLDQINEDLIEENKINDLNSDLSLPSLSICNNEEINSNYNCAESTGKVELNQVLEVVLGTADGVPTSGDSPNNVTSGTQVIVIETSHANDQENNCMTDEEILYAIANEIAERREINEMISVKSCLIPKQKNKKSRSVKGKEKSTVKQLDCRRISKTKTNSVQCNIDENFGIKTDNEKECIDNKNDTRIYQCDKCSKVFNEFQALTDHLIIHVDARPACDICGKHYKNSHSLRNHKQTHNGKKNIFSCEQPGCGKSFKKRQYLIVHQRIHTKERPYKCCECDKTFSHSVTLQRHARVHSGEKPYSCPNCGKCFAVLGQYSTHLRIHTGEKRYQCTKCDKQFVASGQLTVHMRTHTKEKPFKCDVCSLAFAHSSTLKTHKHKHSGEKPHSCKLCGNKFTTLGQLTNHFRTHTGEKPFSCDICGKGFVQSGNLKVHKNLHFDENSKRYYVKTQFSEKSLQI